ncbi:hypothetical protein N7489_005012, partial [Penicillium chrysogenum]|uniref:uncharacterized protein n=1 Tax=Penicillium chrysogenum TaxID=5076 RepID=UPI0024DF2FFD
FIPRLFYPGSSRETVLHEGSDPNRSSTLEPTKADMSMMSKEQPTFSTASVSAVPAKDSAPIRLHTVRIWFFPNGLQVMEDVKRKDLNDVVFDAIILQDHGNTKDAFTVDLAVLEDGILRVRRKYGIINFIPLSSDDPMVLQQSATDTDSKKALCYRYLHSKYQQEYGKRRDLAAILGYEIHKGLNNWYNDSLQDIGNRLEKLGYI